ncbi:putative translational regulatory protein ArgL [Kosakonia oryzendophytica]
MPPLSAEKISPLGLQMNIHPYKLNFNSISGLSHVRKLCLRFIRNIS